MVLKRLRNARKRWNKSKIGSRINTITGNRYGRGWKQIATKGIPQMVRDVAMLKSMVNAEKKRFVITSTSAQSIGQVNYNSSGYLAVDITPTPSENATQSGRSGSSVKLNSAYMKFQFYHQSSTVHNIKLKMYVVQVLGVQSTGPGTFLGNMFLSNSFVSPSITDFNSQLNPDYFRQYRIIKQKTVSLPPDSVSNAQVIKEVAVPLKFRNYHVRFNQDTNTVTAGQLFLFILADSGNISSSTASTCTPIPVAGTSTGCLCNYNLTYYYYDN